jgi:cytochrome oxidase Cu insertion factor (SCO1/SenC/PrrC family)
MPTRRTLLFAVTMIVAAALVGLAAVLLIPRKSGPLAIGSPDVGGPFSLVNQDGVRVTDKDFRGRYMLVFFGYTFCPDVCPTELQVITQAIDGMGEKGKAIQAIFVSIDPARDTPDVLKSYVSNFGAGLVGLTGSPEEIAAAAKAYRVYYRKSEGGDPVNYLMDHSSIIYLMGPDGRFVKHFTFTADAKALANGLAEAIATSS